MAGAMGFQPGGEVGCPAEVMPGVVRHGLVEVQKKLKSQEGLPVLPAPPGRAKSE